MRRRLIPVIATSFCIAFAFASTPAEAQFGKLKDKLKNKAKEETDKVLQDGSVDTMKAPPPAQESAAGGQPSGGTSGAEDMTLYTKYDFVPGDKVIFYDDLANEEIGEFPSRWNLDNGVFEIAKQGNDRYIMCTNKGSIRPKVPPGALPPKYTAELEFYSKGPDLKGHWFSIYWLNEANEQIGQFEVTDNHSTKLSINGNDLATKELAEPLGAGIHTMRIMATKTTIKCYVDNERVANVPAVEGFVPVGFQVYMDPWLDEAGNPMLMRSFRYAEGGKTLKEQLDESGKIVTHGILFDSGSAKIRAESYKTLADIGQLLAENPALRVSIEGHTDSDGADDSNLKLSQDRSTSVKIYLAGTYKIEAGRLETRGWGEGKPIDTNNTTEGKTNNRRVELVKL